VVKRLRIELFSAIMEFEVAFFDSHRSKCQLLFLFFFLFIALKPGNE